MLSALRHARIACTARNRARPARGQLPARDADPLSTVPASALKAPRVLASFRCRAPLPAHDGATLLRMRAMKPVRARVRRLLGWLVVSAQLPAHDGVQPAARPPHRPRLRLRPPGCAI